MDNKQDEVLLRLKTMDTLLDDKLEELNLVVDDLDAYCYTLRMYTEWMMGTVGPNSVAYPDFARLKDGFLTFEVLLSLDDRDVTGYVRGSLYPEVRGFRSVVGKLIVALEEVM